MAYPIRLPGGTDARTAGAFRQLVSEMNFALNDLERRLSGGAAPAAEPEPPADGSVTEEKLAPGAVTAPALAPGSVTGEKLASSAVTARALADACVTADKLGPDVAALLAEKERQLQVATVTKDNLTLASGGYSNDSLDVSRAGWTPVGIVGYQIAAASDGGTRNSYIYPYGMRLSGSSAIFYLRNLHESSAAKYKITAYILYRKDG